MQVRTLVAEKRSFWRSKIHFHYLIYLKRKYFPISFKWKKQINVHQTQVELGVFLMDMDMVGYSEQN